MWNPMRYDRFGHGVFRAAPNIAVNPLTINELET